ncbi:hypothetical protein C8R43DRAFT_1118326 [Mycena crocata]|nr:hypothetical protein C8R43DRAFT_1118326 [Mycena crocata]
MLTNRDKLLQSSASRRLLSTLTSYWSSPPRMKLRRFLEPISLLLLLGRQAMEPESDPVTPAIGSSSNKAISPAALQTPQNQLQFHSYDSGYFTNTSHDGPAVSPDSSPLANKTDSLATTIPTISTHSGSENLRQGTLEWAYSLCNEGKLTTRTTGSMKRLELQCPVCRVWVNSGQIATSNGLIHNQKKFFTSLVSHFPSAKCRNNAVPPPPPVPPLAALPTYPFPMPETIRIPLAGASNHFEGLESIDEDNSGAFMTSATKEVPMELESPFAPSMDAAVKRMEATALDAQPRTRHMYLSLFQMDQVNKNLSALNNTQKLEIESLRRKVTAATSKISDSKRFLFAVATKNVPRLSSPVSTCIQAGASFRAITQKIETALLGNYRAFDYDEEDLDLGLLAVRLGGRSLLYSLNHSVGLPSIRTVYSRLNLTKIIPTIGPITVDQILGNILDRLKISL